MSRHNGTNQVRRSQAALGANQEDPPDRDESQNRQRRRWQSQIEQDLFSAEEEIEELKRQLGERDAQVRHLRATQDESGAHPAAQRDKNRPAPTSQSIEESPAHTKADAEAVRAAGRRCAVLHMPWNSDSLFDTDVRNKLEAIIARIERRRSRNDEASLSDDEDPVEEFWRSPRFEIATPETIVEEVMSHMSLNLAKRWLEPWFCVQFREGMRKIRSEVAGEVADRRQLVFQMSDNEFGERREHRKRGNGAKKLLEDDAYMWAPDEPEDPKELSERFFRSECLIRVLKLFLLSPSSVESNKRSPQAGLSRLGKWRIKSITPSILSFVAIVVHFVLSGDLSFDMVTATANYADMYEANLRLLRVHKQRHRSDFKSLMSFYNETLFPGRNQVEEADKELVGMSAARRAFYLSMISNPPARGNTQGGSDEEEI